MSGISANQHCTSEECPITHSRHPASVCGYEQTKPCPCRYCTQRRENEEAEEKKWSERTARIAASTNRKDSAGRKLVDCEWEDCVALDDPQTFEEYTLAYEHWRRHNFLSGCSHGA